MSTLGVVQLLFASLALIMGGLGLSLEIADFRRIVSERRAVVVALTLQFLVLPVVAFGLAVGFDLAPEYAVGLMLLAAAPASISSNLYSHVFGGNVALNMTLTGLNTAISIVTLPLLCGWAMQHFTLLDHAVPDVTGKLMESMAILVIPVVIGMVVRVRAPAFAARAEKKMRLLSIVVLAAFSIGAIVKEWASLATAFSQVGATVVTFNLMSLAMGYLVAKALCRSRAAAITIAFELGVRSAVLSMYVAMTILQDTRMALPAAVYSVTMVLFALSFGFVARGVERRRTGVSEADAGTGRPPVPTCGTPSPSI